MVINITLVVFNRLVRASFLVTKLRAFKCHQNTGPHKTCTTTCTRRPPAPSRHSVRATSHQCIHEKYNGTHPHADLAVLTSVPAALGSTGSKSREKGGCSWQQVTVVLCSSWC